MLYDPFKKSVCVIVFVLCTTCAYCYSVYAVHRSVLSIFIEITLVIGEGVGVLSSGLRQCEFSDTCYLTFLVHLYGNLLEFQYFVHPHVEQNE